MSQIPRVTVRHWASQSALQEHDTHSGSVGQREKTETQQTGKHYAFILVFAISGSLAEIKFCSNSPEVVKG